jgi:hypothetical protein
MTELTRIYGVQFSKIHLIDKDSSSINLIFDNPSKLSINPVDEYTLSVLYPTSSIVTPGVYTFKTNLFVNKIPRNHAILAAVSDNLTPKRYLFNIIDGPDAEIVVVYNATTNKNVTVEIRLYIVNLVKGYDNISTDHNIYPQSIKTKLYYDDDGHPNFFLPQCNKFYRLEILEEDDYDDDDDDTSNCSRYEESIDGECELKYEINFISSIIPVTFEIK